MSIHLTRVAIVDDDAAVLDSMRFLLEVEGHLVEPFDSGQEALRRIANEHFDCAILDHHMPELTGLELAQQLRAAGNALPIMLMSGAMTQEIAAKAAAMGLQRVVAKPVSDDELMEFVEQAKGPARA